MKTLVIPDIHNRWELVDKIINRVSHDKIVFLGDFFDQFHDTRYDAEFTAIWVKKVLSNDNAVAVFGNHDMPYWRPHNENLRCPGFDHEKCRAINAVIPKELWEKKFNLVWFEQGWTLSHAGFHPKALPYYPDFAHKTTIDQEYIARAADEAFDRILEHRSHPLLEYGYRMGQPDPGGCFWLHWGSFAPIKGVNQIVGHTPANEVRTNHMVEKGNIVSRNYCIDGNNRFVGIINDGEFSWLDMASGKEWRD